MYDRLDRHVSLKELNRQRSVDDIKQRTLKLRTFSSLALLSNLRLLDASRV